MLFRQRLAFGLGVVALLLALALLCAGAPFGVAFLMGMASIVALGTWLFLVLGMPVTFPAKWCNDSWWIAVVSMFVAAIFRHVLFAVLFGIAAFLIALCKIRSKRAQD
jgi:hypothetical protein